MTKKTEIDFLIEQIEEDAMLREGMWTRFAKKKGWETDVSKADAEYEAEKKAELDDMEYYEEEKRIRHDVKKFLKAINCEEISIDKAIHNLKANGNLKTIISDLPLILKNVKEARMGEPEWYMLNNYRSWVYPSTNW